jgi:hypothetical protein
MRLSRFMPVGLVLLAAGLAPASALAADELRLELNAAEPQQNRCQLSFLIENRTAQNLEALKLDLALFNTEGVIQRRLAVDLGPLRKAKTIVKAFGIETDCAAIGAILVNDITACPPMEPGACLDQLALSARPKAIKFYK